MKKKKTKSNEHPQNLEWYMENFEEICEVCGSKMIVHSFRDKGKYRRCVFAHCENMSTEKLCKNRMMVIGYYV